MAAIVVGRILPPVAGDVGDAKGVGRPSAQPIAPRLRRLLDVHVKPVGAAGRAVHRIGGDDGRRGDAARDLGGKRVRRDARGRFRRGLEPADDQPIECLEYASTLAVTDEVNARSIAPITCTDRSLLIWPLSADVRSKK